MTRQPLYATVKNHTIGKQDVTKYVRWIDSTLNPSSYNRKSGNVLVLGVPLRMKDSFTIKLFDEVWVGTKSGANWTNVLFGGLILKRKVSIKGGEKIYRLDLVSYDYELAHISVPGWPTLDLNSPPTAGYKIVGYPPNLPNSTDNSDLSGVSIYDADPQAAVYNVRQWIEGLVAGGLPYNGLIPFHTNGGIELTSGWSSSIGDTRITFNIRPSNSHTPGHLSIMTLQDAIEAILNVVSFTDTSKIPVYWMEAVPKSGDATEIVPRLKVIDLHEFATIATPAAADVYFSDVRPLPEGAHKYWNFELEYDGTTYQNYVEVFGPGGEMAGYDPTTHEELYAVVYGLASSGVAPEYSLPHSNYGVQGKPYVVDGLESRQQAALMAEWIHALASIPIIRTSFNTYTDVKEGQSVWIKNRVEGLDGPMSVLEVTTASKDGLAVRSVTCGWPRPDASSLTNGPFARLLKLMYPLGGGVISSNGTPLRIGSAFLKVQPTAGSQNILSTRYDNVDNARIHPPANVSKRTERKQPIADVAFAYYNALQAGTIGSEAERAAAQPIPSWLFNDIFGLPRDWFNPKDGTNHPQHYIYMFPDDTWQHHLIPDPATIIEMRITELDDTRNIVSPHTGGIVINMERARTGVALLVVSPLPDRAHPLDLKYGDVLNLQATGIPDGHILAMFLSERLPLVEGRTALPTTITSDTWSASP